jgi:hypothetical protein
MSERETDERESYVMKGPNAVSRRSTLEILARVVPSFPSPSRSLPLLGRLHCAVELLVYEVLSCGPVYSTAGQCTGVTLWLSST